MIHYRRFYKEDTGAWYIDLPEYIEGGYGSKANLLMVAGADKFLERLANGKNEVNVLFMGTNENRSTHFHDYFRLFDFEHQKLEKAVEDRLLTNGEWQSTIDALGEEYQYGATYSIKSMEDALINPLRLYESIDATMWLCPVTAYVFEGIYPNYLYSTKVDANSLLGRMKPEFRECLLKVYNAKFPHYGLFYMLVELKSKTSWLDLPYRTLLTVTDALKSIAPPSTKDNFHGTIRDVNNIFNDIKL